MQTEFIKFKTGLIPSFLPQIGHIGIAYCSPRPAEYIIIVNLDINGGPVGRLINVYDCK